MQIPKNEDAERATTETRAVCNARTTTTTTNAKMQMKSNALNNRNTNVL
jgi:hypothetical protein